MNGSITTADEYSLYTVNALKTVTGFNTTVREIKGASAYFLGYILNNNDAAARWLQVFFRPASTVILGTTPPDFTIRIGASETVAWDFYRPVPAASGLSVACTTTETGSTGPTSAMTGTIYYK